MIWLTWRQFRLQALVVLGVVAALAVLLALTGPGLLDDYQADKINFLDRVDLDKINFFLYAAGLALLYAAPPVIGAFWGAPLIARELEAGTHRLVWTQSISRSRWLAVKLGLTGLTAVVITGLLSLAVTWWSSPFDQAANASDGSGNYLPRLLPPVFGARGVVPIGYAAFAFALGVAIGLVVRRSVVAIAITLTAVIAVQVVMPLTLRPQLITPAETTVTLTPDTLRGLMLSGPEANPDVVLLEAKFEGAGGWKLSDRTIDASGQIAATIPPWVADCGPARPGVEAAQTSEACFKRLADEGYKQLITYQPASRFWGLQWREAGIFFALALALTGFCFWRIRRDLS